MKHLFHIILTLVFLHAQMVSLTAGTFEFNNDINNNWSHPGNWTPYYPGSTISIGDEVIISGQCHISWK